MVNKLVNSLKRGLLYLSVPLALGLGSCSVNKNYIDDVYYTPGKEIIISNPEQNKEKLTNKNYSLNPTAEEENWNYSSRFRMRNDFNRFDLGWWDSDGDGIEDWADPWPHDFGPYIDMNGNGIIDLRDVRVSGFGNDFLYYNLGNHSYWYDDWDYDFGFGWNSPFYHNYYWGSPFYHNYGYSPWGGSNNWGHWDNWNHWNNDWGGRQKDNDVLYGHRNTPITDGPAERIYNRSSNGDLIKNDNSRTTSTGSYVRPQTSSATRIFSPSNNTINSSERTTTQYRSATPTRTNNSSNSGAVRTYTPPQRSSSSSNTTQRSTSSYSSGSGATRSGSYSGSSSGATRSGSSTSSSSGASRTTKR